MYPTTCEQTAIMLPNKLAGLLELVHRHLPGAVGFENSRPPFRVINRPLKEMT